MGEKLESEASKGETRKDNPPLTTMDRTPEQTVRALGKTAIDATKK